MGVEKEVPRSQLLGFRFMYLNQSQLSWVETIRNDNILGHELKLDII